jgi:glyoxylase-like metal-dependent hydrolase (beta-lactamase superfamily II)
VVVLVSADSGTYQAFALRYGSTQTRRASKYYRYDKYDDPDRAIGMDFFFWLVRNERRTVLVDCGFDDERTAARGYFQDHPPLELLSRLDVSPGEVDHVVISHMHFDHIGNLELFPNATFSVARAEFDFWTGPFADRPLLSESTEPYEVQTVVNLLQDGRLRLIDDAGEALFDGIDVLPVRGHTPGQMISTIRTPSGQVVLASDAVHLYEEMELDRPYWVFNDLEGMYRSYDLLRTLDAQPGTTIVAGHDPAVMTMFESVNDDCVDLTIRR